MLSSSAAASISSFSPSTLIYCEKPRGQKHEGALTGNRSGTRAFGAACRAECLAALLLHPLHHVGHLWFNCRRSRRTFDRAQKTFSVKENASCLNLFVNLWVCSG